MKKELEHIKTLLENHVEHIKQDISRLYRLYMMMIGIILVQLFVLIYDKLWWLNKQKNLAYSMIFVNKTAYDPKDSGNIWPSLSLPPPR